jgi:hypothetical protein
MRLNQHFLIALIYFLIVAVLGFLLRLEATNLNISILTDYHYVVHAHSHTALLGWVYLGFSSIIVYFFIDKQKLKTHYHKIFGATQVCLLGMLITFPIQGYALFSIVFSTLFLIISYVFFGFVLRHTSAPIKFKNSFLLIKHSLVYMVLSSLGPWALGGIIATVGKTSIWYRLAIYFYLHFQYNAWFILAALGLLVFFLEKSKIDMNPMGFSKFLVFTHIGIIGTLFLSGLWATSHWAVYLFGNIGSLALWVGLYYFWLTFKTPWVAFRSNINYKSKFLLNIIVAVLLTKLMLQTLSGIPFFAEITSTNTDVVIGYLHWFFLGFVSLFLVWIASIVNWIKLSKVSLALYLLAFLSTEFLIYYRAGIVAFQWPFIQNLNLYLALGSGLFVVAIFIIIFQTIKSKTLA